MDTTIPKDVLHSIIEELGNPEAGALMTRVVDAFGWADKQEFTKNEFLSVLQAATEAAQSELKKEAAFGDATKQQREHMGEMLAALGKHAIPVLMDAES